MFDKHLNFGVYEATDAFRAIQQHSCVCFDDLGLVAVTGRAEDHDSQRYAELFAAAPELLHALQDLLDMFIVSTEATDTYCEVCQTHAHKYIDNRGNWTGQVDPIAHKPGCAVGRAEAVISKVLNGEPVNA